MSKKIRGGKILPIIILLLTFQKGVSQYYEEIHVGQEVPDVSLGKISNLRGYNKLSDLKGKIVILDFWASTCGTCISEFPKMKMLQEKFKDQIQVILITSETEDRLEKSTRFFKLKGKIPDLPSIIEDTVLNKLFPHKYAGHYVWIDAAGVVRMRGIGPNNSEKKLTALMKGKPINFLPDSVYYGDSRPFFKSVLYSNYYSSFSGFSDLAHAYGEQYNEVVDTTYETIRTTFLNKELLEMYLYAFSNKLNEPSHEALKIISSYDHRQARTLIEGVDSSKISNKFFSAKRNGSFIYDDEWIRNNNYCYELVIPMKDMKSQKEYIQQDLNRFFAIQLGINGKVEKRKIPCYVLVKEPSKSSKILMKQVSQKDEDRKDYEFGRIISSMSWGLFEKKMLINETGIDNKTLVNMTKHTDSFKTLDAFQEEIKKYGLKVIPAVREIPVLVFYKRN